MAAKAEEILPPLAAVAGGASEGPPPEEAENREGARLAKRRRTFSATLETLSSPAAEGEELGESGRGGFSFSFDARSVAPIETTPKFGSFHRSASDLGSGESALKAKKVKAKRWRTSPPALETRSSPDAAEEDEEEEEEEEEELGGSALGGFSFSFDARSVGTVEANPKFGSFRCAAADLGSGKAEEVEKGGADGGGGKGKIGISDFS